MTIRPIIGPEARGLTDKTSNSAQDQTPNVINHKTILNEVGEEPPFHQLPQDKRLSGAAIWPAMMTGVSTLAERTTWKCGKKIYQIRHIFNILI